MLRCLNSLTLSRALWRLALPIAAMAFTMPSGAAVMISQLYGGGGNSGAPLRSDFVELHNSGSAAVSVAGWSIQYASASGSTWSSLTPLAGSIPAGGYYLIKLADGANSAAQALPAPDAAGMTAMSATAGKVALVNNSTALSGVCPLPNTTVVDFVGYGSANCAETAATPAPSNTNAVIRASAGNSCVDSNDNSADFAIAAPQPRNSQSQAQPCRGGAAVTPSMAARIFEIQGSGVQSPLIGKTVVTQGVVTKINNNGFFVQDLIGDANDATSEGLFVFATPGTYAAVALGNLVNVTGTVAEFNTGATPSAETPTPTLTQLTGVGSVTLVGNGYSIAPTLVNLPEASEGDLERVEGMLVTVNGPLTVSQNFFQGRYGQLTLSAGGRLETPTNRHRPGSAQAIALANENARRRIVLDDGTSQQNPNPTPYLNFATVLPRAGDTVGSITGVIDFGLSASSNPGPGDYKIHPTLAPSFSVANPRTGAPAAVGGNLKVASFNVLNYFTTFRDGSTATGQTGQGCSLGTDVRAANCRGASNLAEFERQRVKIVEAITAINADVVGLIEIQNNGNMALQNLVDALNTKLGVGTYVASPVPAEGTGSDAIRVAIIYKPTRLSAVAAPVSDTDSVNNRPTLAQTFSVRGERFTLFVNHFKSKGSCPAPGDADAAGNLDSGDGQGCWNATRLQQAQRLSSFVARLQAASGSANALLIGDLNAYAQEDPIFQLTGSGYVDQIARFGSSGRVGYSYVFDGAAGRLDHAITSNALSPRVTGATIWHINADETALADYNLEFKAPAANCGGACPADPYQPTAYRSSDHDPVVVGLSLFAIAANRDSCVRDGWRGVYRAGGSSFTNQGDCIQYVNTGK